ncbi:MAG: hypothetical protein HQL37_15220 [Alphaproteobacteria bacterium]|nr:hypothetical protein [Alphaproteobacteria bacterium]
MMLQFIAENGGGPGVRRRESTPGTDPAQKADRKLSLVISVTRGYVWLQHKTERQDGVD